MINDSTSDINNIFPGVTVYPGKIILSITWLSSHGLIKIGSTRKLRSKHHISWPFECQYDHFPDTGTMNSSIFTILRRVLI